MPRAAPITKNHLIQNVSSAEAQNLSVALCEHDRSLGQCVCPDDLFTRKPAARRQQVVEEAPPPRKWALENWAFLWRGSLWTLSHSRTFQPWENVLTKSCTLSPPTTGRYRRGYPQHRSLFQETFTMYFLFCMSDTLLITKFVSGIC